MNQDFTYVTRTRKSRRNKSRKPDEVSLASIKDRFETTQSQFVASEYCYRCLGTPILNCMLMSAAFKELLATVDAPERIVCLGLGSLVEGEARSRRISEVQLALLLELNRILNVGRRLLLD